MKPLPKTLTILAILVALYTIIGFLLVPFVGKRVAESQLKQKLSPTASIGKIAFNPYTFRLQVEELTIPTMDGDPWIGLQMAVVDLSASTLIEWHPVFDQIELLGPSFEYHRVASDASEDDGAAPARPWRELVQELADVEILAVEIRSLKVSEGEVTYQDDVLEVPFSERLYPIEFAIEDFTTVLEQENAFSLVAKTPTDASFQLTGRLSTQAPRKLDLDIELLGVRIEQLAPYYNPFTNFELEKASLSVTANASINLSDPDELFHLSDTVVALEDVLCSRNDDAGRLISFDSIRFEGLQARFPEPRVDLQTIRLSNGATLISRDLEGRLNLLSLVTLSHMTAEDSEAESAPAPQASGAPFAWRIGEVVVDGYEINWEDAYSEVNARADIRIETFTIGPIESDLSKHTAVQGRYRIGATGIGQIDGAVAMDASHTELQLSLEDIALPLGQEYLQQMAGVEIERGRFNLDGEVKRLESVGYSFTGSLALAEFRALMPEMYQLEFELSDLQVNEIALQTEPLSLSIAAVDVAEPNIVMTRVAGVSESAVEAEQTSAESGELPALSIGAFTVTNGSYQLNDQSVQPAATLMMSEANTSLAPIDLQGDTPMQLKHASLVNRAPFDLNGSVLLKDPLQQLSLQMGLDGLSLPQFSPYSGQAIGRELGSGSLRLEGDWGIQGQQLKAKNALKITKFNLGGSVESPDALVLPYDLAIALLRSPDGSMNLNLPISGDLSDPKLSVGGLVVQAFVNLITKSVTAPFNLLAGIAGSNDDISEVIFGLGSAELSADSLSRLESLAGGLQQRESLRIRIIPTYSEADRAALQLLAAPVQVEPAGEGALVEPELADAESEEEELVVSQEKASSAKSHRLSNPRLSSWPSSSSRMDEAIVADAPAVEPDAELEPELEAPAEVPSVETPVEASAEEAPAVATPELREVSQEELKALAAARANAVREALLTLGLAAERMELSDAEPEGESARVRFEIF